MRDEELIIELPVVDGADAGRTSDVQSTQSDVRGMKIWRSLDDLKQTEAFRDLNDGEFAPRAAKGPTDGSRRDFLKIMGASAAMAGLTACRRPVENILPYTRKPEEVIPGKPLFYATAMPFEGILRPLLVEAHEGRPTKVEGNPEHPVSLGASGLYEQASILNLYDPDRSKRVLRDGRVSAWNDFVGFVTGLPASSRVLVIASPSSSPTEASLRDALNARFASIDWVEYSPAGGQNGAAGNQLAFGTPFRTSYQLSKARIIVSLDADFLSADDANEVANAREYATSRRVMSTDDDMSRLYAAESSFSLTGGMADHRLRVKSSRIAALALGIAARLGLSETSTFLGSQEEAWVDAVVADLEANRGECIVMAGRDQAPAVHASCALLNAHLGNVDSTVRLYETSDPDSVGLSLELPTSDLSDTVAEMKSGAYDVAFILETNPAYSAPAAIDFTAGLAEVQNTVHLGSYVDETALLCSWHVPAAHYLEAWGDGRAFDGTLSVIQPLIAPLYADSKSRIEVLNILAGDTLKSGYELVTGTWRGVLGDQFDGVWAKVIHDGLWLGTGYTSVSATPTAQVDELLAYLSLAAQEDEGLELVIRPDRSLYDGMFSNNAWMQELPDPVTKITWDNYATVSPATARELGVDVVLEDGQHFADVAEVAVNGRSIRLPVWVSPGQADGSIAVTMGYGRSIRSDRATSSTIFFDLDVDVYSQGALANGVGSNVAPLLPESGSRIVQQASVTKVDEGYLIASTQDHPSMEGRPIVRMATLEEFKAHPTFADDMVPPLKDLEPWDEYPELWNEHHPKDQPEFTQSLYSKNQWGMAIDLNACTGCNACVVACQSENNIQVVGKEEVANGREMAWVRLDRYFTGEVENAGMVVQPMMCVHCENAPCESVCPVAATIHSPDGLNVMVYNRCIGTRYCANNCPYKVRRFNYYNWTKTLPQQVQMGQNPDVTVRFRGVMEKCTYCIQRIRAVGIAARQDGDRAIADGEVKTACQQACPSQAITFGNLADAESEVVSHKSNPRAYELLAELNVQPRTSFLARLRNPSPSLEGADTA